MRAAFAVGGTGDRGVAPPQPGSLLSQGEAPLSKREPGFADPVERPDCQIRTIAANEFLFRPGDPRTHIFRVETGAICIYESHRRDRQSVVEFVFPGDFVGFGFLEKHILSARALLESSITCVPVDRTDDVIKDDARARGKLAVAVDREIEARREELFASGQRQPIERVAALLVTSSRTNVQQGREANLIEDTWRCGVIADLLQVSLDDLTAILVALERRGLIETTAGGIRLKDIDALEALADRLSPESGHGARIRPRSALPPKLVVSRAVA